MEHKAIAYNAKGQATLPKEEEFMDKYEIWLLNNRLNNKVIGSKEKTGHYYVSDAIRDYELEKFGNVAKPDACAQLYEGWRDRSDKSYYNEKRILIFTPCYEDITMRWRIIDSQFMDLCTEASHWKKLDEPAFI